MSLARVCVKTMMEGSSVFYFILHADLEDALVCVCVCVRTCVCVCVCKNYDGSE